MEINEQNFNDLLSNDDVQIDEDINEEDIQNEDLLGLSDFNHSESDDNENEILVKMKLSMENIDKLVHDQGTIKELKIKNLRNSIELLSDF